MNEWAAFAGVSGAAAATLTGLIFVSASIRLTSPDSPHELRLRAAQTVVLFTSVLVTALLVVVPGQRLFWLGIELLVLEALTGWTLVLLGVRADHFATGQRLVRVLKATSPNLVATSLAAAAGILLMVHLSWGLYLLAASNVLGLVGGVASSWLFLLSNPGSHRRV